MCMDEYCGPKYLSLHGASTSWAIPFNPFNSEFAIIIFILYKPRIAIAIIDLYSG